MMARTLRIRIARAAGAAALAPALLRLLTGRYDSSPRTSRRDFLRWTVTGAATFALAEAAAGFVAFFWPLKIGRFGTKIAIPKADIPAVGASPLRNREGKFWLIHNEEGLLALHWKCVHLGCTVPWNEQAGQFHCPCHASIYDRRGVRVAGPAPRPLDIMAIEVGAGGLVVDSGRITQREAFAPDQAVAPPA